MLGLENDEAMMPLIPVTLPLKSSIRVAAVPIKAPPSKDENA